MADDLAALAAGFGAALRRAGLPVGPGRSERFAAAVTLARPATRAELLNCALATLVSSKEQGELLGMIFAGVFGPDAGRESDGAATQGGPDQGAAERRAESPADAADLARAHALMVESVRAALDPGPDDQDGADQEISRPYLGSPAERLAGTDFAELSESELAELAELMRRITLSVPPRRSRRHRPGSGGRHIDMRASLRRARRTGGDVFRLIGGVPVMRSRRLVVLCDISGSMEPYARAMIQLLYCAAGGAGAEVFSFATRLTRLTPALARSSPAAALREAGHAAPDWLGGTRLGDALKQFNDGFGRRGLARGAVVLIISDGWDTGDPAVVRREMERLSLVAFRIVWVNPRTKSSAYEPLAGGMAAAWPFCDAVVSGHTLNALQDLTVALADPVRRRAELRPAA
jgi:uncharacterized protein with von Willebrand factor type A (vWA) domain